MDVVIVESEFESSKKILADTIKETLELGKDFANELIYLSENGFKDILIDNAIVEKSFHIYTALKKIDEASENIIPMIDSFMKEADEQQLHLCHSLRIWQIQHCSSSISRISSVLDGLQQFHSSSHSVS